MSALLAQDAHWPIFTKDNIERSLEKSGVSADLRPSAAYEILLNAASLNLKNSTSVIVDAVFGTKSIQDQLTSLAVKHKAILFVVHCFCSNQKIWQQRIESRPEIVDGWTPADWTEVQRVEKYYEPWGGTVLKLDAVNSVEKNFQLLKEFLI